MRVCFCRFDSNQVELNEQVKNEDKLWLVRHLERMRIMIVEDLINVKVSSQVIRVCRIILNENY